MSTRLRYYDKSLSVSIQWKPLQIFVKLHQKKPGRKILFEDNMFDIFQIKIKLGCLSIFVRNMKGLQDYVPTGPNSYQTASEKAGRQNFVRR
jgi:hypothetical protein